MPAVLVILLCALFQDAPAFQPLPSSTRKTMGSPSRTRLAMNAEPSKTIYVALTREKGKNAKLESALKDLQCTGSQIVESIELPCIEHADGPDYHSLQSTLTTETFDYVIITSPEAARVLSSVWNAEFDSKFNVAAVGKATGVVLEQAGIPVSFCPSKATAETLAKELPATSSNPTRVLYPASCRAKKTLEEGLRGRMFQVVRLNTYDTVTSTWDSKQQQLGESCQIACFASPSSIKGWLHNMNQSAGNSKGNQVLAACIGETSAQACREHGWEEENIFYPEKPGIDGWVEAVSKAVDRFSVIQKV